MEDRRSHYNKSGMYAGYNKNNKEREKLDYYATPPKEVTNILNIIDLPLSYSVILEPSAGGGHMEQGILNYLDSKKAENAVIIASDVQDRNSPYETLTGQEYDFLSDSYMDNIWKNNKQPLPHAPYIDYIIMNPPYSIIEPFCMKTLGIAEKGILLLARLQFLEGVGRYKKIFSQQPPTDVYVYYNRTACFRNGDFSEDPGGAQAYAWFFWDFTKANGKTEIHWIKAL